MREVRWGARLVALLMLVAVLFALLHLRNVLQRVADQRSAITQR